MNGGERFAADPERVRSRKVAIEAARASHMPPGSWFGLVSRSVQEHLDMFGPRFRPGDKLVSLEIAPKVYELQQEIVNAMSEEDRNRVLLRRGSIYSDLFKVLPKGGMQQLNGAMRPRPTVFSYGQIDLCCTAIKATDDGLLNFLKKLAQWWALRDRFVLELAFGVRNDYLQMWKHYLTDLAGTPSLVEMQFSRWWNVQTLPVELYRDTGPMRNACFILTRKKPREGLE